MRVLADSGLAEVGAICDLDPARLYDACARLRHQPVICDAFEELLELPLDGVVIATPNWLHESQAAAALDRGLPVFSQKPLALTAAGTRCLLDLSRRHALPLGVDWSYRHLAGMSALRQRIADGEIGSITAAELSFHNAYGPDAAWYYELASGGGGCLLDLGCHLLDLCHWLLGARGPADVRARCFRNGVLLSLPPGEPEDFVMADVDYDSGQHVHLSCSWRAAVGRGAVIGCRIFGTDGGAAIHNVGGSFYDFEITLHHGDQSEVLGHPPDDWPGRALLEWTRALDRGNEAEDMEHLVTTAELIDTIYGRGGARA